MSLESELYENVSSAIKKSSKLGNGVAFSGGVDSSLVALASQECELAPVLLTVGYEGSRDVRFATHIAKMLPMHHCVSIINDKDVTEQSARVDNVVGECSLSWRENCIAFALVAKLASSLEIDNVVTANGIDELFCGYNAYRTIEQKENTILEMMRAKLENEKKMMQAVNNMTKEYEVNIVQPLLDNDFVEYAMQVPLECKITGQDDLLRKHLVRSTAEQFGVPAKSAYSRKKALQYGTGIHAALVSRGHAQDRTADRVDNV